METKNLAKRNNGRLRYYGSMWEKFDNFSLERLNYAQVIRPGSHLNFFRAENKELITDGNKVVQIKALCYTDGTPLNKIPMGKKSEFIAGDPVRFKGIPMGIVKIRGRRHLEIEIIPGKLYFYSRINQFNERCYFLKVVK